MLDAKFLREFRRQTEMRWRGSPVDPQVYGFQFQAGTRWCPGLTEKQILAYENDVDVRFPSEFKSYLRSMNGTDLPTVNIYGSSGEPSCEGIGVYSYPRDLNLIRRLISGVSENRDALRTTLAEEAGFELSNKASLMPIYAHRFVICEDGEESCPVLSIWSSDDAIVYGVSLREYLEREFLDGVPR